MFCSGLWGPLTVAEHQGEPGSSATVCDFQLKSVSDYFVSKSTSTEIMCTCTDIHSSMLSKMLSNILNIYRSEGFLSRSKVPGSGTEIIEPLVGCQGNF